MVLFEKRLIEKVLEYKYWVMSIFITILAFVVRYSGRNYISEDMGYFLLPWYEWYKTEGLIGLGKQVGDYNLMYQTIMALMAKTSITPLYIIKIFSILFDFVLAGLFVYIVKWIFRVSDKLILLTAYASVLMLPTVIVNSAYWGQIDAMYTVFVLITLILLYRRKYTWAFFVFGVALGCKLQSVFIIPFIGMLYLHRKDFSLLNIGYSVIAFWAVGILSFVYGRSLTSPIDIYYMQTGGYPQMYLNFPSFWVLFSNDYWSFGKIAIISALTILLLGTLYFFSRKNFEQKYFPIVAWTVWTSVLFLPKMHERYGFLLDILLLLLCFKDRRYLKYALVTIILSIYTYGIYFAGIYKNESQSLLERFTPLYNQIMMTIASVINIVFYCCYTYCLMSTIDKDEN